MPRVICTRPNASDLINGVRFEPHENGVISEQISEEEAQKFLRIPGYQLADVQSAQVAQQPTQASVVEGRVDQVVPTQRPAKPDADGDGDVDDDDLEILRERARSLGIKVNPRWKHERLTAEIEKVEEAKKDADAAANADGDGDEKPE